jgi:hypothetical protein
MNEQLKQKLAGRVPLVIAVEGSPADNQSTFIIQLGIPVKATIHLDGIAAPMNVTAVKLTPKEAISLAVRLTELVGPLDIE